MTSPTFLGPGRFTSSPAAADPHPNLLGFRNRSCRRRQMVHAGTGGHFDAIIKTASMVSTKLENTAG
jgi:hypothetical protein